MIGSSRQVVPARDHEAGVGFWPGRSRTVPQSLLGAREQLDAGFACHPQHAAVFHPVPKRTRKIFRLARARALVAMDAAAEELRHAAQPQGQVSFAKP